MTWAPAQRTVCSMRPIQGQVPFPLVGAPAQGLLSGQGPPQLGLNLAPWLGLWRQGLGFPETSTGHLGGRGPSWEVITPSEGDLVPFCAPWFRGPFGARRGLFPLAGPGMWNSPGGVGFSPAVFSGRPRGAFF